MERSGGRERCSLGRNERIRELDPGIGVARVGRRFTRAGQTRSSAPSVLPKHARRRGGLGVSLACPQRGEGRGCLHPRQEAHRVGGVRFSGGRVGAVSGSWCCCAVSVDSANGVAYVVGCAVAVDLGPAFQIDFGGTPPQISTDDLMLWETFRRLFRADYVRFYFDVAVGTGEGAPPNVSEKVAAAWRRLTRFRIDVVGEKTTGWDIIELRPNAGPGGIGALQTYTTLWFEGPPDQRPIRPLLVSDRCPSDIRRVAGLAGIELRCLDELVAGLG